MEAKKISNKHNYFKPEIKEINLDKNITLWLMSQNSIPDAPPWGSENDIIHYNDPYKTERG